MPWKPNPSDDLGDASDRHADGRARGGDQEATERQGAARGVSGWQEGAGPCRKRMTEAIAETGEGREQAKAADARIKEFRVGGWEVESEEPVDGGGGTRQLCGSGSGVHGGRWRRTGWRSRSERRAGRT